MSRFNNFLLKEERILYHFLLEKVEILPDSEVEEYSRGRFNFSSGEYSFRFYNNEYIDVAGIKWLDLEFSRIENNKDTLQKLNTKFSKQDVFSKVITCLSILVKKYQPENFRFIAGDQKLITMYDLLLTKFWKFNNIFDNYTKTSKILYGKKYYYCTRSLKNADIIHEYLHGDISENYLKDGLK